MNNVMRTHHIYLSAILTTLSLFFSHQANALDINVTAKVLVPPCIVNNGNAVSVDFGNAVIIPKIDGQNYKTTIPYTIQCDTSAPDALKLQIRGGGTTFDADALQTSQNGLGIIFYQNGQPLALNKKIDVSYLALPVFEASPIKQAGAKLVGGAFTAGATLAIYYD